jgi:1,4-alpha-glucan branching enzyme
MRWRGAAASDWAGWADGSHDAAYEVLGAHPTDSPGEPGAARHWEFRVWAPNARAISVVADWNGWDPAATTMMPSDSGVWAASADAPQGSRYKYRITSDAGVTDKADPFAFHTEEPPGTASVLWDLDPAGAAWTDGDWMADRHARQRLDQPMSVYEVHLGSWDHAGRHANGHVNYREVGKLIGAHATACGFTHVELMPVMEHPFYGSWGYQSTGYFAPSCRYGSPDDLVAMIDEMHNAGLGVILDWVPSHFPDDAFALAEFDGTHLYEHADPRLGFHPDWHSLIFNYGRAEVRAFLTSSARFWLDRYHADGLRVDAVASMLYLDYSRKAGEWIPNRLGGRENIEAVEFLQHLNRAVYRHHPDVHMIAEESTAWPGVTRPVHLGGLGFGMKWDMGWMHDTLEYLSKEPVHRRHHHREITFRSQWAYSENYTLPLSHDEVVHGKRSLIGKMPGDPWQRFANLRLLFGWQWAQPGKKLLFMGGEVAQEAEWSHESHVPWRLDDPARSPNADHTLTWVRALNDLYRAHPALAAGDCQAGGFEWVVGDDEAASVCAFLRWMPAARSPDTVVLCVANFTPVVRHGYELGVPFGGEWSELLTSDDWAFGGSGITNAPRHAWDTPLHGQPHTLALDVAPLAIGFYAPGV